MTKKINPNAVPGVMSRLIGSEEGNIIALFAASIIPVIGLVGGGVDMSRIYLTHTRLQGACDAGALIGRKMMGVGTWDANDGAAGDKALAMFDSNFVSGAYSFVCIKNSASFNNQTPRILRTPATILSALISVAFSRFAA